MKNRRKTGKLAFLVCMAMYLLGTGKSLHVAAHHGSQTISLKDFSIHKNGGEIKTSWEEENGLKVQFDTTGEEDGYFTSFFYAERKETLEEGDVVSFHISTEQKTAMNLNIILAAEEEPYKIEDGSMVFIKADEGTQYEMLAVAYGTFLIPKDFSGNVYLPIKAKDTTLRANGLGFLVIQKEEEQTEFTIKTLKITDGYEMKGELFQSQFQIKGERVLEIPVTGEYYYPFAVSLLEEDTELECGFYVEDTYKGVRMEASGRLFVSEDAEPATISIGVEILGILQYRFQIELTDSWITSVEDEKVRNFVVPHTDSVAQIEQNSPIPISLIRGVVLVTAIWFSAFYNMKIKRER